MAMSNTVMGNARANALLATMPATGDLAPTEDDKQAFRDAIALDSQGIIDEIIAGAEIETTVTGTLPAGPTDADGTGGVAA